MKNYKDDEFTTEPLRMADIADKLDPDVQAELKAAFVQMQRVGAALEAALVRRTVLLDAFAVRIASGEVADEETAP